MNARGSNPLHGMILLLAVLLFSGCSTAYYKAWEMVGVEKRDLLKKRVVAARDEQKEAGAEFKDALTRLKEITGYQGGRAGEGLRQIEGRIRGLQRPR